MKSIAQFILLTFVLTTGIQANANEKASSKETNYGDRENLTQEEITYVMMLSASNTSTSNCESPRHCPIK